MGSCRNFKVYVFLVLIFGFILSYNIYGKNAVSTYSDLEMLLCIDKIEHQPNKYPRKDCPTKGIITVEQGGRLGNQLFEYASAWVVSKETGLEAFIPRCIHQRLSKLFDEVPLPTLDQIGHCPFDITNFVSTEEDRKNDSQDIRLKMYSTKEKLLAKWLEYIPREFKIREVLQGRNRKFFGDARKIFSNDIFVGVHVRRTDYSEYISSKYDGKVPGKDFFLKAMDYFEGKYKNVTFMMTSDDMTWCRENFGDRKNVYFPPKETAESDMALFSACNHSIFDYGTYGGWGALYAGGETIYYHVPQYRFTQNIAEVLPTWHSNTMFPQS